MTQTPTPPKVREIHWNALPEPTRRRLIESLGKRGRPAPFYENPMGRGGIVGFSLLAVVGIVAIIAMAAVDFGHGSMFHQDAPFILGYLVAIFCVGYGLLAILRRALLFRSVPFRPGVYLFATDVLDARDPVLRIWPLGARKSLQCVHHHTNGAYTNSLTTLTFPGETYSFSVRGKALAESKLREMGDAQRDLAQALANNDAERLYQLDVFFEARMSPVWDNPEATRPVEASSGPTAGNVPAFTRRAALLAAALATLTAAPLWFIRNQVSDEVAYRTLSREYHARSYIRRGGNHAAAVQAEVLPRLALEEAQRRGTVAALRQFLAEFGGTPQAAIAQQAIHAHYERVRADFMAQANTADGKMVRFVGALLTWLEQNGSPPIFVTYAPPSSAELVAADARISAMGRERGGQQVAPIAPHFAPSTALGRESVVTNALSGGFGVIFPGEILELRGLQQSAGAGIAPLVGAAPSILVRYALRPSGSLYSSDRDPAAFVGLHVDFDVTMSVPGTPPYSFSVAVEPPERFRVSTFDGGVVTAGSTATRVYDEMARRAFARLGASMAQTFFRADSPAYQRAIAGVGSLAD